MGYRSDIVIVIKKDVLARHLLTKEIPQALLRQRYMTTVNDKLAIWELSGWKWYKNYPEIQEIEKWFKSLDENEFGAIRLGEDDTDIESWGTPWEFDVNVCRTIEYPLVNE